MKKLMLGLLALISATARAFGVSPLQPDEPIANIFGLVVGMFAFAVALAVSGQFSEMQPQRKLVKDEFGGGGASGTW